MFERSNRPVLVAGGTGHFGRHIVQSLQARGQSVRVLSRNAGRAVSVLGAEVELLEGDLVSSAAVAAALDGAQAVVISVSAFTPQLVRRMWAIEVDAVLGLLASAERAGVRRVVYLSVYQIERGLVDRIGLESGRIKAQVEAALACSYLDWTVLGASPSTALFFAMIRGDTMMVPGGGPPCLPTISPADLGEIAAQAVLRNDLGGRRFRLAGPEAVSFPEAARRISRAIGRPIRYRPIPVLLPRLASAMLRPFAPLSNRIYYVRTMLQYVRLLNAFPPEIAAQAAADHQLLLETFRFHPTTLEMDAQRWIQGLAA